MNFKGANFLTGLFLFYSRKIGNHPGKLRALHYWHRLFKAHIKVKSDNGTKLLLTPKDYISSQIIFNKAYEPLSLTLALDLLQNTEGAFLDVGANIGLYSATIGKNYPHKQIVSIEPDEKNFKLLNKNILLNNCTYTTALNVAAGECVKLIQLECAMENNNGTVRVITDNQHMDNKTQYAIMLDLNTILNNLNVNRIDLLKIDIEGYEMEAFKGLDWFATYKPQNIIMEYSDYVNRTGSSMEEMLSYLTRKGYSAFTVEKNIYLPGDHLPEDNLWLSLSTCSNP